jgi:hypothetical protein
MRSRIVFVVLTIAMCVTLAPGNATDVGESRTVDFQSRHEADLDVACLDITIPPQTIDFDTTFVPQIKVKNNRYTVNDVPVRFVIVRTSDPTDTIYHDTTHTGPIGTYQTHLVDFTRECTPAPGLYTMTGITELPGDTAPHNDTCSMSLLVRKVDVATDVLRPAEREEPGLVSVNVKLTNMGSVTAWVPRVDVTISPSGYHDYGENIAIGVGQSQTVTLNPWVCPAGSDETCTAWIIYPADMNHANDTDVVVVNRAVDVAAEIVSPRDFEEPGLVSVQVKVTNVGDVPALVSAIYAWIRPGSYFDYRTSIAIAVGESAVVLLDTWDYTGGTETCTAQMACFADTNHSNDTDVVIVNVGGVSGSVGMEPYAGMSMTLSPSPLAGSVLHVEYSLNQTGPASVTIFDISGRPVATQRLVATRTGEVPMDLRRLSSGVYLVRLEDGRQSVVQKLVVQRWKR